MATQDPSGATNPPPIPSQAALPQPHDHNTCPPMILKRNARHDALQVYNSAITIPEDQRGQTNFLTLALTDIPSAAECLRPGADTSTEFPNLETAQEYRKLLLARGADHDPTIPRTQAQQRAHALALFKAFKCIPAECEDRDDMKKWFVEERHNNQLVEVKCWEILHECITRSIRTTNLVEAHEPNKFRFKAGNMTFAERFDIIKETMAVSKTICKHLFDVSFVLKFVDDPAHNRARVESNRVLNSKKAEIMKRGKEEQEKDKKAKRPRLIRSITDDLESGEELDDLEDSDYGETPVKTESPRKTRSTRIRASTRAPTTRFPAAAPVGSMSAPQMRPNMYTPGTNSMRNSAFQYDQSPLASYSSSMTMDRMTDYENNDAQLMPAANLSHSPLFRNMYYPQNGQQSPALASSPFSSAMRGGMNYNSQTPNQQIMRPESSMSVASQITLYQPIPDAIEPWNPHTPTPRHVSVGSTFYNGNGMNSNWSLTNAEPTVYNAPGWIPPSTPVRDDGNSDWGRYNPGPPQFPQQFSPIPVRPRGFMIPEEITPANVGEDEQGEYPDLAEGRFLSDEGDEENSFAQIEN